MGRNNFSVQFPSKIELERLKIIGTCRVPNSPFELTFDSWSQWVEPLDTFPEIWVRVSGIPPKHKGDFLAMWYVDYLLGKTLKVDMAFTRKHGVLRILVGCLNHTKIPHTFTMLIKGALYALTFEVEGEEVFASKDVVMAEPRRDNDEDDNLGDDFRNVITKETSNNTTSSVVPGSSVVAAPPPESVGGGAPLMSRVVLSPLVQRTFQAARESFFNARKEGQGAPSPGSCYEVDATLVDLQTTISVVAKIEHGLAGVQVDLQATVSAVAEIEHGLAGVQVDEYSSENGPGTPTIVMHSACSLPTSAGGTLAEPVLAEVVGTAAVVSVVKHAAGGVGTVAALSPTGGSSSLGGCRSVGWTG